VQLQEAVKIARVLAVYGRGAPLPTPRP
jgi:hypothetical protein